MSLCTSCNYPIPSWQHNGACKPVAEKIPEKLRLSALEYVRAKREGRPQRLTPRDKVLPRTETPEPVTNLGVTENPPALPKRRGRPKKDASLTAAQKQAAYRARKQQS